MPFSFNDFLSDSEMNSGMGLAPGGRLFMSLVAATSTELSVDSVSESTIFLEGMMIFYELVS